jgi:hypothetical protein
MRGDDEEPRRKASMSGRPVNWNGDQMRPDEHGEPDDREGGDRPVPTWNEDQMTRQRPDGTRSKGPSAEEIGESKRGLSGGGANPGGGERWADRDSEPATDDSPKRR